MAKGQELGSFSMQATSVTVSPGVAGSTLIRVNYEGTADGFGTIVGTGTFVGGPKGGALGWCGVAYSETGDQLTSNGSGAYESVGVNRWGTSAVIHISDGSAVLSEGVIDLASRSLTGKNYAWT